MRFADLLKTKVKPELNHIYTEKPFNVYGGSDMGWFCREHAMHLFVLARLAKLTSNICLGDFLIKTSEGNLITSINDDSDHAWCIVDRVKPVDISLTLKYVSPMSLDVPIVYGSNFSSDNLYTILYFQNKDGQEIIDACSNLQQVIAYREREVLDFEPVELLSHPFEFLFPPSQGSPKLTETLGDDVFFRITYHCYKLIFEDTKPLFNYRDSQSALRTMVFWNPNAEQAIRKLLKG